MLSFIEDFLCRVADESAKPDFTLIAISIALSGSIVLIMSFVA